MASLFKRVLSCFIYSDNVPLLWHLKLLLVQPVSLSRNEKKISNFEVKKIKNTTEKHKAFQRLPTTSTDTEIPSPGNELF